MPDVTRPTREQVADAVAVVLIDAIAYHGKVPGDTNEAITWQAESSFVEDLIRSGELTDAVMALLAGEGTAQPDPCAATSDPTITPPRNSWHCERGRRIGNSDAAEPWAGVDMGECPRCYGTGMAPEAIRRLASGEGTAPQPGTAPLVFTYTNHEGVTAQRHIVPRRVEWGSTEWHPAEQWFLVAHDLDRNAERWFPLAELTERGTAPQPLTNLLGQYEFICEHGHHSTTSRQGYDRCAAEFDGIPCGAEVTSAVVPAEAVWGTTPQPATDIEELRQLQRKAKRMPGCPPAHEVVDRLPGLLDEIERLRGTAPQVPADCHPCAVGTHDECSAAFGLPCPCWDRDHGVRVVAADGAPQEGDER